MEDHYLLSVRWKKRPMTAREYLAFSKGLLQELSQFDSVFENLYGCGKKPNQKAWFTEDYCDFNDKVLPQINDQEIRYENADPDNWKITLDSKSFKGFRNSYSNTDEEGQTTVSISGGATEEDITDLVNIKFPKVKYSQFYDYEYVSALMKIVIEYCQPDHGFVISEQFWDAIELEDEPGICPIGWLTYLSNRRVTQMLPANIEREILATGGTLFTLKRTLPSVENTEDISAAIGIRDTLIPEGLLGW